MANQETIWIDDEPVGWIRDHGCVNPKCLAAIDDGRPWHAIPRCGTLPTYHFATRDAAVAALTGTRLMIEHPIPEDDHGMHNVTTMIGEYYVVAAGAWTLDHAIEVAEYLTEQSGLAWSVES